ncbi:MAG: DUF5684 domain-containing protein [Actinobacteria bacterium]|nr:DUF5684 domain-containing protein [Actinomycetota bacterium]
MDTFTIGFLPVLFVVAAYVYYSFSLMTIAAKTSTENGWMAWIPVLNLYLMCKIAGRPGWWLVLMLVPLVNVVMLVIVWMGIAEARGFPGWWGIMMLVPLVNIIVPGYLAFTDHEPMTTGRPIHH